MTDVEPYDRESILEQQIEKAERRAGAVRMRVCGMSLAHIARQHGYADEREAADDIRSYLDELLLIPASEWVARQAAVTMDMMRAAYKRALDGDTDAMKQIKDMMDHQAKLFGLYAPTRHKVSADDNNFSVTAASLIAELGIDTEVAMPPTIDASEPWA